MVIARNEWFERKNKSDYYILDISWQGIAYFAVMVGCPIILLMMFSPEIIVAGYYSNSVNIAIIALAWFIFTFTDFVDAELKDPIIKLEKEDKFKITLRNEKNGGLSITLTLIIGASISIIYNIHSWNFYLGLFATTAFVTCMVIAITKYKFRKKNQNENFSEKSKIHGE